MIQSALPLVLTLGLAACAAPLPGGASPGPTGSPEAAASTAPTEAPTAPPGTPTPEGAKVSVKVGERFSLRFASSGAGGYVWELDESTLGSAVKFVEKQSGPAPEPPVPGRFADEVFVFEGAAAGTATLRFRNYRSWEGPEAAIETREHVVTVEAAP